MTVERTSKIQAGDNLVMVIYGKGGVGKTTFTASAPDVLLLDFENGSKFLGDRGIDIDVVRFDKWLTEEDKKDLAKIIAPYKTIAMDPLGEAMEKLLNSQQLNTKKFRQSDGSLTMAGWGEAKSQMRAMIKWLRDSGKNVIIVAHVSEEKDGEQLTNRIQVATRLREEIPNIVDIISYMGVKIVDGEPVRVLYTPRQGDQFDSKDRTGRVPMTVDISEKDGFNDLLRAMKISKQEIPTGEVSPPAAEPEDKPKNGQRPGRRPEQRPGQPPQNPNDILIKDLTKILDDGILDGLIVKADRDSVIQNAKKAHGKALENYIGKIKDHLENLKNLKNQKKEQAPPETEPEEEPETLEAEGTIEDKEYAEYAAADTAQIEIF